MASETMTVQEAIAREYGIDLRLTFCETEKVAKMADEIIRLRTTAGTGAGGERVTVAMVEAARAAFSREWYEDVEARPMRVALTAALAASARGAA